jgi:tRNA (guanine-N7-)-methyltransferase
MIPAAALGRESGQGEMGDLSGGMGDRVDGEAPPAANAATASSRIPTSAQTGVHAHLGRLLDRHLASALRKPYADYNRAAFDASLERRARVAPDAPLILDSCCGVGESSRALALSFPDHYVIGVDQSESRLTRNHRGAPPPNLDLVRADLVDYWRLLVDADIRLHRHYLLYPNPWPKIGHLARRWHGHPVFPALLELGGVLECRSNWRIYIDEFCFAINRLTARQALCEPYAPASPMTPFERKYLNSGHPLYRTVVDLDSPPPDFSLA